MKALLAIEWLKIKRYRTFWILAAFFIVLLPLWNYQISSGMISMGGNQKGGINLFNQAYSFPEVWGNVGFWGSIFVVFLSILVIILTTNEFNFRTHRQNVIDGWDRMQFYHAKVWLVVLISLGATLYLFLNGLIFGITHGSEIGDVFNKGEQLLYFFLLTLNYLGLALFISLWIKRSGLAIGIFMLYCLILENILKGLINWGTDSQYANLLPLQSSDELLPFPMMSMAKQLLQQDGLPMSTYLVTTVIWCLIYYFAGKLLLQRRDW
jgi:hypothetical protein